MMLRDRRQFLALLGALPVFSCNRQPQATTPSGSLQLDAALRSLEGTGQLGVAFVDSENGRSYGYRDNVRFPLCSTFKLLLAAQVLRAVDRGQLDPSTIVPYTRADLVPHAPVTEAHLSEGGMTLGALAQAAQMQSDNVAANLLLKQLGGPQALTAFCRELSDPMTRLDRYEPLMNLWAPGDEQDTTTPRAMARLLQAIFAGRVLSPESRLRLKEWMLGTQTGIKRLRAGLSKDWSVGDKTGTHLGKGFPFSKYNDIACVWFTNRRPLLIAAYYVAPFERTEMSNEDQLVLARVGALAHRWFLSPELDAAG